MRNIINFMRGLSAKLAVSTLVLFALVAPAFAQTPLVPQWAVGGMMDPTRTAYSPDGQRFVVTNGAGIHVYSTSTGRLINSRFLHGGFHSSFQWTPDSQRISFSRGLVYLWDPSTNAMQTVSSVASLNVFAHAYASDGSKLAVYYMHPSLGASIRVLNLSDNAVIGDFQVAAQSRHQIAFNRQGDRIIAPGPVVYTLTGTLLGGVPSDHELVVNSQADIAYSINYNSTTFLWEVVRGNTTTGAFLSAWNLPPNVGVDQLQVTHDGTQVVLRSTDTPQMLRFYAEATGAFTGEIDPGINSITALRYAVDPTQRRVMISLNSDDRPQHLQFLPNASYTSYVAGTHMQPFSGQWSQPGQVDVVATFLPGTSIPALAVGRYADNGLNYYSQANGSLLGSLPRTPSSRVYPSDTGNHVVAAGQREDGTVGLHIYNAQTNGRVATRPLANTQAAAPLKNNRTVALVWNSATSSYNLVFFQYVAPSTLNVLLNLGSQTNQVHWVNMAPGGDVFAVVERAMSRVRVRTISTNTIVSTLSAAESENVLGLQMLSDTRLAVWRSTDGGRRHQVALWDVSTATPTLIRRVDQPFTSGFHPYAGGVSPDQRFLVLVRGMDTSIATPEFADVRVDIFSVATGALIRSFQENFSDHHSIGFNPERHTWSQDGSTLFYRVNGYFSSTLMALKMPSEVASVGFNPPAVLAGNTAEGTVTLDRTAPAGGMVVNLASSNDSVATVPATVTVPAGASSATFTINTFGTNSNVDATISAVADGVTVQNTLQVQRATMVQMPITPDPATPGTTSTATVMINARTGTGGVTVNITTSTPGVVTVPASVTIPAGSNSVTFPVQVSATPTAASVDITATIPTYGSISFTETFNINVHDVLITLNTHTIKGGNAVEATFTLPSAAPAGGRVLNLTSSNAALTVPATLTVPAGQTSVSVGLNTTPVAALTDVTLSAAAGGVPGTVVLTVQPPVVTSLVAAPNPVIGGNSVTLLVLLDGFAPSGFSVPASSNNVRVTIPATVTVPAGAFFTTVNLTTRRAARRQVVLLIVGGRRFNLTLLPTP